MSDRILTEAFDKLKAIEESDDPFCIGAKADDKPQGYTAVAENAHESSTEMPDAVLDDVIEALELALDAVNRRDEVTDDTFNFVIQSLSNTLKQIDPHYTFKGTPR